MHSLAPASHMTTTKPFHSMFSLRQTRSLGWSSALTTGCAILLSITAAGLLIVSSIDGYLLITLFSALMAFALLTHGLPLTSLVIFLCIAILLTGIILPIPVRFTAEMLLMGIALCIAFGAVRTSLPFRSTRIAFILLVLTYALAVFNSNVPDVLTGLEGSRRVLLATSALLLGLSVGERSRIDWRRHVSILVLLMMVAAASSLFLHIALPDIEASLPRQADLYTAMIGGEARMQGLMSGPFHVAMLGAFLTLLGISYGMTQRKGAIPVLGLGAALVVLSSVRTGMISIIVGAAFLIVHYWLNRTGFKSRAVTAGTKPLRTALVLIAFGIGLYFVFRDSTVMEKLWVVGIDQRSNNRLLGLIEGWNLFLDSPIIGWGAGSAASGLSSYFHGVGNVHVSPHNGAVGIAVEVGIGGLMLFIWIWGSIAFRWFSTRRKHASYDKESLLIPATIPLAIFWIFGDALAALPVSLCLCLYIGLIVGSNAQASPLRNTNIDGASRIA